MQKTQDKTEILERIAELRNSFARLKQTCGLRAINQQTIELYAKQIQDLQSKLKGGDEEWIKKQE